MKSGTIFDNFLITDDEKFAEEFGNETWGATKVWGGGQQGTEVAVRMGGGQQDMTGDMEVIIEVQGGAAGGAMGAVLTPPPLPCRRLRGR